MVNKSTIIKGDETLKPCVKHAASLMYDVYDIEKSDKHIAPAIQKAIDETKKHYQPGAETTGTGESKETKTGYYAKFYKPLNQDKYGGCPPVLMFRGSEMNKSDVRDLNIAYDIKLTDFRFTGEKGLDVVSPVFESLDKALEWVKSHTTDYPLIPDLHDLAELYDAILPDSFSFPDINFSGVYAFEKNQVNESLPGKQPLFFADGSHKFALVWAHPMGPSLPPIKLPLNLEFNWHIEATLHYGPNGDWGANVTQALGGVGKQYELAMADALEYAVIANNDYNGRLIIMGHSLGGGLASAAAAVAKNKYPKMTIISRTFNAAGLHDNTPKKHKASVNQGSTQCSSVKDEILTTLQSHPEHIPLLKPFLDWADDLKHFKLPPAKASLVEVRGVSPEKSLDHHVFPKRWSSLSKLFPINEQTMGKELSKYGASESQYERVQLGIDSQGNPYYGAPVHGEDETNRIRRRHQKFEDDFATILMVDKWARRLPPDKFVQRLAGWFLTGSENAENEGYLDVASVATITSIFGRKNQLMAEANNAKKLVLASVDYHLADMCLFTYILDKKTHG